MGEKKPEMTGEKNKMQETAGRKMRVRVLPR